MVFELELFIPIEVLEAIYLLGGTVDGFLLRRIECQDAVAQLLGGIDDGLELAHANHLIVAVGEFVWFLLIQIAILPFWCGALEHQSGCFLRVASLYHSAHKLRHQPSVAAQHVGRSKDIIGQEASLGQ